MIEILLTRKATPGPAAIATPQVREPDTTAGKTGLDRADCRVQLPFLREMFTRFDRERTLQERREARLRRARAEFGLD